MNLEQNNLNTQIFLMKDILKNYKSITYGITEKGKELLNILRANRSNGNEVLFTKEQFDKMVDIASILEHERKFNRLGILAESAVPDNENKIKILDMLQKA